MLSAYTPYVPNGNSSVRRYLSALLLLAIASLTVACGGAEITSGGAASATAAPPASSTTARLAWDPVAAPIAGYHIYYGKAPGVYLQPLTQGLNAGTATTYAVAGLQGATRYYFAVTAFYALGNESDYSIEAFKDMP
jgi:hypothetical protein